MNPFVDSAFPGLAIALNPENIMEFLREALKKDHENLEVKEAKILDVKYKPGDEGVLLYRFKIKDRLTNTTHRVLYTATLLKEGEPTPNRPDHPCPEKTVLIRNPFFYFEDAKILLTAFPSDPRMPWLNEAMNEALMQRRLNLMLSHKNLSVQTLKVELLNYTPRLRAVFLYSIQMKERGTENVILKEWIGKTSSYKVPEVLFADLFALWKASEGKVGVPRPELYFSNPRLFLQQRLPGKRLGDLLKSSSFQKAIVQTARAIALIHKTKIPLNKIRDPFRETQSLRHWSTVLQNIRSDLGRRLQTLQQSLLKEMESRTTVTGTVHGDFHPANVLVDNDSIYIIDFDQMAYGDPAADVGRFLASLRVSSLRHFGDLSSLEEAREIFLNEYLIASPASVAVVRMFESASLITTAASAFRVQRPGWEHEVSLMLQESERVFETAKTSTKLPMRQVNEPSIKFEQVNEWLQDPEYMRAVIGLHLRRNFDAEIIVCNVINVSSTPVVSYKLDSQKDGESWICELEAIPLKHGKGRQMFNQLASLEELSSHNGDAFVIPKPMAYVSVLKTILQIPLSGILFTSLIEDPEFSWPISKLARAISSIHNAKIVCHQTRSIRELCEQLNESILTLDMQDADFSIRAGKIFARAKVKILAAEDIATPIISALTPESLLLAGDRIGLIHAPRLLLSHPCTGVSELLAGIVRLGIERNRQSHAGIVARELRSAYCNIAPQTCELLPEFEILALLSLACSLAKDLSSRSTALQLLERAE